MANLQVMSEFSDFITFIKEIDKWAAEFDKAKETVAELRELQGAQATVKAANAYRDDLEKKLAKRYLDLDDKEVAFAQREESKEAEFKKREAAVSSKENELSLREGAVSNAESVIRDKQVRLDDDSAKQEARSVVLDKREKALNDLDLELKAKAQTIKSLVG